MNFIYQAMFFLLNSLHTLVGNYGLAIVLLTVLIRAALWPINSAQTRSMRKMQELQPKLKALQEKHKNEPQKMQEAMMKFYSENSFNPLAGCLPMLVQLPIFIGLYGAIGSPHFLAQAVDEHFLFIHNLAHTLQSHAGKPLDGAFNADKNDTFSADRTIRVTLANGTSQDQDVTDQQHLIEVFPKPILPGMPITMTLDFTKMGLSPDYRNLVKGADVLVVNNQSRELERVHFDNQNGMLTAKVDTQPGQNHVNYDVLALILAYGVMTLLYQRVMTSRTPKPTANAEDPTAAAQASMMKFMPLMFVVMFFFIPIPAGALIYLVVTTALMFLQTVWVNFTEDRKKGATIGKPSEQIVDVKAD